MNANKVTDSENKSNGQFFLFFYCGERAFHSLNVKVSADLKKKYPPIDPAMTQYRIPTISLAGIS